MRRRAKAVNYGLAYGMNAWGLATRLDHPDEPRGSSTRTSKASGDQGVPGPSGDRATVEGFTETLLGRRRYIPELQAANPRVRDLGRRQALNAPIQGSASDVFKVGTIAVDGRYGRTWTSIATCSSRSTTSWSSRSGRTVPRRPSTSIRDRMEHAVELDVDLRADVDLGANWSEAAPEGHTSGVAQPRALTALRPGPYPSCGSRVARAPRRKSQPAMR